MTPPARDRRSPLARARRVALPRRRSRSSTTRSTTRAKAYAAYVERFAAGPKEAVFVGMNPGPFGMAQTGVPFGEVASVRDWLGIRARDRQARARASEAAGRRLRVSSRRSQRPATLGLGAPRASARPTRSSRRFFVANYCPLALPRRAPAATCRSTSSRATSNGRSPRTATKRCGTRCANWRRSACSASGGSPSGAPASRSPAWAFDVGFDSASEPGEPGGQPWLGRAGRGARSPTAASSCRAPTAALPAGR